MSQLATLKKRIGQRLIVGFEGTRIPSELARLDEEWGLGGFILFERNLQDVPQILNLNEDLWGLGQGTPPFISVEEEGCMLHRLPEPFTVFPDMQHLGKAGSVSVAYEVGAVIGRELAAAGFNLNFAPVLDVNSQFDNSIVAGRTISEDPDKVTTLGKAVIRGLHDNAIAACAKHFPGIGSLRANPSSGMPTCELPLERLQQQDLKPFQKLIQNSPNLDMVFIPHVMYPKIDSKYPASLSRIFIQDILKKDLSFKGLAVSENLEAKEILEQHSMAETTVLALEAGVDLFLVCQNLDKQVEVLETLLHQAESGDYPKHVWELTFNRIRDVKASHFRVLRAIDRVHAREVIGNREHQRISRRLRDGK